MKPLLFLAFFTLFLTTGFAQPAPKSFKVVGGTAPAGTERRIAIVIGNKDYQHVASLRNPLNDAADMGKVLGQLGFEVITLTNASYQQLMAGLNRFKDKLAATDVALVYYSGHGVSYAGKNYLMPVDAELRCLEQVEEYGIALNRVLGDLTSYGVKTSFVFLDACRNLPDLKICDATKKEVTVQAGLVKPTNNPRGSLIVYATDEGSTADDNVTGRNGLFTEALLRYLVQPNLTVKEIVDQASVLVEQKSNGRQSPGVYDKIRGDFIFVQTAAKPAKLEPTPPAHTDPKPVPSPSTRTTPAPVAGTTRKFLDLPFASMAYLEGGTFQMGDTRGEGDNSEKPVHTVKVGSFWMSQYEITQRQWESVMDSNPSYFNDCPDCPVENVSWNDVQMFLGELNRHGGGKYRLPTEAEWEYAAGGGNTMNRTRFANGHGSLDPTQANFDSRGVYKKSYSVAAEYRARTVQVGSFAPNRLGLYDMSGNVWEWCIDWYQPYSNNGTNAGSSASSSGRVLRGGSWFNAPFECRSSYRLTRSPSNRETFVGFRVVSQ